jgi:transcriptional regulator with XRE-family HTH domain
MSIESRIKQVRNEFNLTQSEFAESLGVTRNMISMYELSHVAPPQLFLDHLCLKYGVDPIWLETGDGEMFHEQSIDEEIAEFAGKILGGDNQFKKQVFYALSQMDDAAWDAFQQFYNAMKEAEKKEKGGE